MTVSALAGLAIAAVSAASRVTLPQVGGLLATVPPTWFVGCGLIALAFGYAAWRRVNPAAPVLAAGTVVILSQALMYGTPTVMAAARHIGLIEYILAFGEVDASLDIYQGWPGLFAGSAWLTDATGITSQIALATWWPVLITPVTILAVRLLAGRFLSPNRAWVAAAIYALGDAVNSTYFSPQAYGFLVAMAVIALLVVPPAGESSRRRQLRIGFATVGILGMVVTHQISPFMLTFALTALVAFRLLQPWWAPLLAFVPATLWALVHFKLILRFVDPNDLGSILRNIAPPEHPVAFAEVAPVTRLVFAVPAAALVVLGVIALVVVLRRRDLRHFGLAAAFVSPIGLALGTNYGQEGIFRIVLFAHSVARHPGRLGQPAAALRPDPAGRQRPGHDGGQQLRTVRSGLGPGDARGRRRRDRSVRADRRVRLQRCSPSARRTPRPPASPSATTRSTTPVGSGSAASPSRSARRTTRPLTWPT